VLEQGVETVRGRSWGWRIAVALAGAALLLGLVACGDDDDDEAGGGGDEGGGDITLNLGYVTPAEHPYGIAVDYFVEQVNQASGGSITIETIPTYGGGDDLALLNDTIGGTVDMGSVSTAVWGSQGVTAFDALQAPFLIDRYDLEREVITGDIGAEMLAATEELGVRGLAIHEGGLRKPLGANNPLTSLEDFEGLRIRSVQSDVLSTGLRALGADPTPLPIGEVFGALRDGTVDAMEANLGLVQTFQFYEVADFITANVNFWPFPTALVINQERFDSLSQEQQDILTEQAAKVPGFSIDFFEQPSDLPATLCEEGIQFAVSTPEELAELREAGEQAIQQLSQDQQTGDFITRIQEIKAGLGDPPAPAPLPEGCTVQ
jgi:TRAP-type transport system periplasmic protein